MGPILLRQWEQLANTAIAQAQYVSNAIYFCRRQLTSTKSNLADYASIAVHHLYGDVCNVINRKTSIEKRLEVCLRSVPKVRMMSLQHMANARSI